MYGRYSLTSPSVRRDVWRFVESTWRWWVDITQSAWVPWTTPSSSVITWIYYHPKSVNSYIQAYLPNVGNMECLCGHIIHIDDLLINPNPTYYCGHECTNSPGRWCIHRFLDPHSERMRVYFLTYPTTTSGKYNTTDDVHRHIWIHVHV